MPTKIIGSGIQTKSFMTLEQAFGYLDRLTDEPTSAKLYATVAWVYRCIELRANTLSTIPYEILRGEVELEEYDIDFEDLLWNLEADLCIFGAGYWLKDRLPLTTGLQRLNPQTMTVKATAQGIQSFVQRIGNVEKVFQPEQMVYFRYYNPDDDLGPGTSPLAVALQAADLGRNANVWAAQFFSHGAIPAVILHTEQMIPDNELDRVKGAWEKLTKGVERAWRTVVLRRGLKPEVIGQPIKDLAMTELYEQVRNQICVAFGVPQTMLSDAANYATAREHRLSFYQDTVIPKATQIQYAINGQLLDAQGLEFEFQFDDIEAIQKDEADKADYIKGLVEAKIITKDEAREQLGYEPMTPEQEEQLRPAPPPQLAQPPEPPQPEKPEEQKPEGANPIPPQFRALSLAMEADLQKWERKALAKGADCSFESEFIPPDIMASIRGALACASGAEEVKAAFAAPFLEATWSSYP